MARIQPTAEFLARRDGRPLATLVSIANRLREAEVLPAGQRGVGARHLTPDDAAALLVAMLATDSPSEGPEAVRVYRSLAPRHTPDRAGAPDMLEAIARMPAGDAVAALIEHGAIVRRQLPDGAGLILAVKRPVPTMELHVRLPGVGDRLIGMWTPDMKKMLAGFYKAEATKEQDKVIVSSVTEKTLFDLSDLITSELSGED